MPFHSLLLGVGHIGPPGGGGGCLSQYSFRVSPGRRCIASSSCADGRPVPPSARTQSVRLTPECASLCAVFLDPLAFASPSVGVGNDEDSLSPVRSSNVASSPNTPRDIVPQRGQVADDPGKERAALARK